jgi:competence protein ComEA
MINPIFKSHFNFSRSEQSGILILIILITILSYLNYFSPLPTPVRLDVKAPHILKLQRELDSLRRIALENRKPKLFSFNPNFITDFKAYALGMTTEQFDALKAFRAGGNWIRSVEDFQKVTGVDENWLDSISVYFKFPEWTKNQNRSERYKKDALLTYSQKTDLNIATPEKLQRVNGIGPALSERIILYRSKLGGFTDDIQLYFVYGLEASVVEKLLEQFTVKTPKEIMKININKASASDIATIPGIPYSLAKSIWEFVRLRDGLHDLHELTKFEEITARKLMLIQLYLSTD